MDSCQPGGVERVMTLVAERSVAERNLGVSGGFLTNTHQTPDIILSRPDQARTFQTEILLNY
jgi:hypothetical protein